MILVGNINACPCGDTVKDAGQNTGKCPFCNDEGEAVSKVTVEHLVTDENRNAVKGEQYRICINGDCDVVYYSVSDGTRFLKEQVKVPIWFKRDAKPRYACYCSKVTEEDVIDAVIMHGAKTVQEVKDVTGAMKHSNCKVNNPMGACCHKIILEAINKALASPTE